MDRIRYRLWVLNCTRAEWVQRIFTAWEAGYGRDGDGDDAMFRYWCENVKRNG